MTDAAWAHSSSIQRMRMLGLVSLVLLIAVCVAWEWFLAPLRSGGSWLILKVLPLVWMLPSVLKGRRYTFQYGSMLILFYFTEGVMRVFDADPISRACAAAEVGLSLLFFIACLGFSKNTRQGS